MFTLAQLSDAHLSGRFGFFDENWGRIAAQLRHDRPDLLVATGDIALDAPDFPEDLAVAARRHSALGLPLLAVPGNHDVGEPPAQDVRDQRVDAAALERFRTHFGRDFWVEDREGWRLLGVNSQLVGSGLAEEREQFALLQEAVVGAGERRLAVFTHKPFELEPGTTPAAGYWTTVPESLQSLRFLLDDPRLRLIASGHLHELRLRRIGAVLHAWAPSAAFLVDPDISAGHGGERRLGYLRYRFDEAVEAEFVEVPALEEIWLGGIRAAIYPPPTTRRALGA